MKRALIIFCIVWTIFTILLLACSPSVRNLAASRFRAGIEHIKTSVAADELRTFRLTEQHGPFTNHSTYWFRGEQCIACVRGSSNNQMHVPRSSASIDIFYAGKRIAECDLRTQEMPFVNVPEGITFLVKDRHITIHSEDFSYFEQIFLKPRTNWPSQVNVPITPVLIAGREAFKAGSQHTPAKQLLQPGTPIPHEVAPTLEEFQARAKKRSE